MSDENNQLHALKQTEKYQKRNTSDKHFACKIVTQFLNILY